MGARETAEFLLAARRSGRVVDALPDSVAPRSVPDAYEAQAALVDLLAASGDGEPVGYKVGCTNAAAQELLGADGPFFGRLLSGSVLASGERLSVGGAASLAVEPEYGYRVERAMPPAAQRYDASTVVGHLSALIPSIELVGGCYSDITTIGIPSILADNALNAAWISGEPVTDGWSDIDLAEIEVRVLVDGALVASGTAANVLGHPLNVVAWLANELNQRGSQLEAGDYVTTGTCTAVERVEPGAAVRCEFGPLGAVTVELTD